MSRVKRANFTEEDLSLTRTDIQMLLDTGRPKNKDGQPDRTKKSSLTPDEMRVNLKKAGHKDENIEKLIGDLDSYE